MSDETRPDKIVSADGSAPKPYTEEDVEDLARRLNRAQFTDERVAEVVWTSLVDSYRDAWRVLAVAALDALAEAGRLRPTGVAEITHLCPASGEALTGCCHRSPFELPRTDRLTILAMAVTCGGTSDG